ncbi:MBL fold metallo-hydrolase [Paenibacillus chartarius]|uniref:MBL fold metallo-hydrolase n=1 Tax=Paenibacillus chartarius TaxID=747481 RepID=A0ABV6DJX6_9BACL
MADVYALEISLTHEGGHQHIYPVLIKDDQDTVLVDCGYPHFIIQLQEAAERYGCKLDAVNKMIVTHHDIDHMGCLAAFKRAYPHIEIIAHELEIPYISGLKKSLRLEQAESTLSQMPDEAKAHAEQFIAMLRSIEPAAVDKAVTHAERLPWCGGIEIIHTPGHMPGHISLYLSSSKTLIAGDVVVIEDGRLEIANPQYTLDMEEAVRSVRLLLEYDIDRLICYHGGLFEGNIREALGELIVRYASQKSIIEKELH